MGINDVRVTYIAASRALSENDKNETRRLLAETL